MTEKNLKLWPFVEAKKLLKRFEHSKKSECVFQTGYGPSGLPHIGTFGEVFRTTMVIKAFKYLSDIPTKLFVFSDDMDGLRKVPQNVPNQELIRENLDKPLSSIPDPFGKFESFSEHNNNMLINFLKGFNFEFEFKSATEQYKSGNFNKGLEAIFDNYDKILNIILPTLGKDRRLTYSPFLPICKSTGKVLQVQIKELKVKEKKIVFFNPNTNLDEEYSIFNGECKLQWKVDWAMRWFVLGVDYEMNGKDLIESFSLSNKIMKTIGAKSPVNYTYELFLDEKGEKISKSVGNGISVGDWLRFSNNKSLELFMFQNPNRAKRLFFDVIPKTTDELLKLKNDFDNFSRDERLNSPIWFIDHENKEKTPEKITFNMVLNLASVCNADSSEVLWGFIENYYPKINKKENKLLNELLEYGVVYYKQFILPNKKYRNPTEKEKEGFKKLIDILKNSSANDEAEEIQTKIYEIGMSLEFKNLKDWFSAFYQVILGQDQGPRLGSFIKFYGIEKTIILLKEKIN
ncbi:MAG: lysine--tRNA ligase [Alphaproteobacteria bacterium]|nr:lysine--tRNA ligase [Alphaproteobacteria bacterium]